MRPWVWIALGLLAAVLATVLAARLLREEPPVVLGRGSGKDGLGLGLPNAWDIQPLTPESPSAAQQDLKGKVVLVNFWGTWCPPCRRELPELVDLARRLAARDDFRFLAVSCAQDPSTDLETLRRETVSYLAQSGFAIPVYADPAHRTRRHLATLGAFRLQYPTTLILDRQGKVVAIWEGASPGTTEGIEQTLRRVLDAQPSDSSEPTAT